ncbi:hypothetical protein F8388_018060 [Cannabis sativa]|uniref:Large ribosomal subunit protein mL45 n=1 Tax=Cannabis sativa TaxID=3483 RepID=A0A7J6HKM5_CANSA|nr:hypothetical protein F8388_018060 [Cannabis sativa]
MRWRVTDGSKVRINEDRWIPRGATFLLRTPALVPPNTYVDSLINETREWKLETIEEKMHIDDIPWILGIQIRRGCGEDELIWHYIVNGDYTVASGTPLESWTPWALDYIDNALQKATDSREVKKAKGISSWLAPPTGAYMLNCDAAISKDQQGSGVAAVIKDSLGRLIAAEALFQTDCVSVLLAECLPIRVGLNLVQRLKRWLFEAHRRLGSSTSYSSILSNEIVAEINCRNLSSSSFKGQNALPWTYRSAMTLRSTMAAELAFFWNDTRLVATQAKTAPTQGRKSGLKVAMFSPGFVYEPYGPREAISFWRRWFTRPGWKRTKDDMILELKNAYAIAKLRKTGYSKQKFYKEAVELYREINTLISNGDKNALRKAVTERMYSTLKNEIKQRESIWNEVYWELIQPIVKIRTLRARLAILVKLGYISFSSSLVTAIYHVLGWFIIGVDRNDTNKVFIQLTLEFLSKQKFEAYDSNGNVVSGDKSKEVLVKDIWVFEKSLFHPGSYWRLCGRISL